MKLFYALVIITVFMVVPVHANTPAQQTDLYPVKIRANYHSTYLRIVLEGPEPIISSGRVERVRSGIQVSFPDKRFSLKDRHLPFRYDQNNDMVLLSIRKVRKYKYFLLRNPSRLVIDVYQKRVGKKKKVKIMMEAGLEAKEESGEKPGNKAKVSRLDEAISKGSKEKKHAQDKSMKAEEKAEHVSDDSEEDKAADEEFAEHNEDYSFIPDEYREEVKLLKSGKSFGVLKKLEGHEPEGRESIASFSFIAGEANRRLGKYSRTITQMRKAYIYATDSRMKESALFKRAESYQKTGFLQEAEAYYTILINEYPESGYAEKAYVHLADILAKRGKLVEAVDHYDKAGQTPEALFGMANALHKLEMVEDAALVYEDAMLLDKTYPDRFPGTYYFMGMNKLMEGETEEAEEYLSMIKFGPYKYRADIALGNMAMEHSETEEAIKKYLEAFRSNDKEVRAQALYQLSMAYLKLGNPEEAVKGLEEIRRNYSFTSVYKKALLDLSIVYREQGNFRDSVELLKTLVYAGEPSVEALDETESVLEELSEKTGEESGENKEFVKLWKELGPWLFDRSREDFLLSMSKKLRHEGEPYFELAKWLVKNASRKTRVMAATDLAEYYISMGNTDIAREYMDVARQSLVIIDDTVRVEVKMYLAEGKPESAYRRFRILKTYEKGDLKLLADVMDALEKTDPDAAGDAVAFYEKTLRNGEWEADDYVRLADILFEKGRKSKSVKYYREAFKKNPDLEWAAYRIGRIAGNDESRKAYSALQKGRSLYSEIAKSKLKEISLMNKVREVY